MCRKKRQQQPFLKLSVENVGINEKATLEVYEESKRKIEIHMPIAWTTKSELEPRRNNNNNKKKTEIKL